MAERTPGLVEYPFEAVPDGLGIAHWLFDREEEPQPVAWRYTRAQGCDGFDLWRDGDDYCYAWVEAFVDHDMEAFFLVDVRTKVGGTETRDHLFVGSGVGHGVICEWENKPLRFSAPVSDHRDRFFKGMLWFNNRIEGAKEQWCAPQIGEDRDG